MIEKVVPIQIPPGLVMNGTLNDRAGRWADGDFVRWIDGVPVPIGTWAELTTNVAPPAGTPTSAFAWNDIQNTGTWVLVTTPTSVYTIRFLSGASRLITDITPSGYGSLNAPRAVAVLDGTILFIATGSGLSKLYQWSTSSGGVATEVTQYTTQWTNGNGLVITPERFVVVKKGTLPLGGRDVAWASQGGFTVWAPSGTNTAGSLSIPSKGSIKRMAVVGSETLIWTTDDLWQLEYVGGTLVYGVVSKDNKSGILGPNTLATTEGGVAYWMHRDKFFQYNGFVRELPCDISEHVFGSMNRTASDTFFTIHNSTFGEIWWFYCSAGASTPDRVAIYNYLDNTWMKAALARSAGIDSVVPVLIGGPNTIQAPLLFHADDTIYLHEQPGAAAGAQLTSGPIMLGDGDQLMRVQKVITDGRQSDDDWTLFYSLNFPGAFVGSESTATGGGGADMFNTRITARYVRYKQTLESASSRIGVPKLGVIPSSRR